jgi:hypothetical protein
MGHSKRQERLQVAHMQGLASGGHISLDHVHQLSKRMQGATSAHSLRAARAVSCWASGMSTAPACMMCSRA